MAAADASHTQQAAGKTKGELYESIAFTFCRTATLVLVLRDLALPVTAGLAAVFYVLTELQGKRDTRCVLRKPWLIAALWGAVCLGWLYLHLPPGLVPRGAG